MANTQREEDSGGRSLDWLSTAAAHLVAAPQIHQHQSGSQYVAEAGAAGPGQTGPEAAGASSAPPPAAAVAIDARTHRMQQLSIVDYQVRVSMLKGRCGAGGGGFGLKTACARFVCCTPLREAHAHTTPAPSKIQTNAPRLIAQQMLAKWVEHALPYAAILGIIFAYHHFTRIFLCLWLGCSVHKANDVLRKIVGQTACEPSELAAAVIFVGTNVLLTLWLAGSQQMRALALLPPPEPLSVWQVTFSAAITDSLVRCCGIIPKLLIAAVTMLPRRKARRSSSDGHGGGSRNCGAAAAAATARPGSSCKCVAAPTSTAAAAAAAAAGGTTSSSTTSASSISRTSMDSLSSSGYGDHSSASSSTGSLGSSVGISSRRSMDVGEIGACCDQDLERHHHRGGHHAPGAHCCTSPRGCTPPLFLAASASASLLPAPGPSSPSRHQQQQLPTCPSGRLSLMQSMGHAHGTVSAQVCTRRRARMLALYDNIQSSYRALLPIPIWYCYLLHSTPNALLSTVLPAAYVAFKAYGLFQRGQLLLLATRLVLRTGALYGRYLTKGEVLAGGEPPGCPICQDPCDAPIRLDCSHVFCEGCLAEWLEREPTCPMCRSNVKPPGLTFGDGSTTLLPQLF